ncbi:MAG: hypothetical protein ABL901_01905 [Hyphomicrobiaceae bacterium]
MFKKFTSMFMAVVAMIGLSLSAVQPAEARGGRGVGVGIAAGIIGLGILGAAASARDRDHHRSSCYKGREECSWSDRRCFENRYGDTVCRGGVYRCYRPTICD